jgi:glutaminyl-peptide cyclotransferase
VLNGIARDPQTGNLWVTGKNWPWIYQIQLVARSVKTLE